MLLNYDVLVFTDISHEYLYQKKTKETPFFVLMMHGAGDGEYIIGKSYEYAISKFDLITLSGQKVKGFFKKMQNLTNTRLKVCGYQKFDVVAVENKDNLKLFKNDKPIVLYNPHFKENLSSWHQFGNQILAFFYNSNDYNLIFAPHINLFKSSKKHQLSIDNKYFKRENIHIDLGSYRSVNMSYTQIADVYLGDVSSQIYEFIIQPRPCIFINTHDVNWTNDPHYQNWKLGKVIPSPKHLDKILKTRESWHEDFIQKQQVAIATTFYKPKNQRVTQRIVDEIKELFKETKD
jgi:CDP-glycerol glycerophosphotransferase (TagB/SpsB family)